MSIKGVHCGLRLPLSIEATSDARCPTVRPLASTTYHFRLPASSLPLGKYVDIVNYLCFQRIKRERLEYRSAQKIVNPRTGLRGVCDSHEKALRKPEGPSLLTYHKRLRLVGSFGFVGRSAVIFLQLRRSFGRFLLLAVGRGSSGAVVRSRLATLQRRPSGRSTFIACRNRT